MSLPSDKSFEDEKTFLAVHSSTCFRSALDRGQDITFSYHSPGKIRFEQDKPRAYKCGDKHCPAHPGTNLDPGTLQ